MREKTEAKSDVAFSFPLRQMKGIADLIQDVSLPTEQFSRTQTDTFLVLEPMLTIYICTCYDNVLYSQLDMWM